MLRTAVRANRQRVQMARDKAMPFPVEGWDASSPLAAMSSKRAVQLKNWFPQPGYGEVRRGHQPHSWHLGSNANTVSIEPATDVFTAASHGFEDGDPVKVFASTTMPAGLSPTRTYYVVNKTGNDFQISTAVDGLAVDATTAGSGTVTVFRQNSPAVESLMAWHGPGATQKMIGAAGGAFWDVGSRAYASFSGGGAHGNSRWQHVNFTTSAGSFLYCVNGIDAPAYFDGSTWTLPTITGITASDAVHINLHKRRIWLVLANSTKAAYLATDAISGAASVFDLGSLFSKGGSLVAMTTWTMDGGNGPDDYAVFISSRGQVALYQGTDPSSASTWSLVGTFDLGEPVGRRCVVRYGTSPLIVTRQGLLKLSLQLKEDKANLSATAITGRIYNAINEQTRAYGSNFGWEAVVYPRGTRLVINIPTAENANAIQYVQNTLTGAWCEFDSHDANCWEVFNDKLYFGDSQGFVRESDTGSTDSGVAISAVGQLAYYPYAGGGRQSLYTLLKTLVTATGANRPQVGVSTDFAETEALTTLPSTPSSGALWDDAKWDQATWGGDETKASDWATVHASPGVWASIKFKAQTGENAGSSLWGVSNWGESQWGSSGTSDETMRINGFVLIFEPGGYL